MELSGRIRDGMVVLDKPLQLLDGTRIKVEIVDGGQAPGEWVKDFAGCVDDVPEDASINYHHTHHGEGKP
jgi:hypothetical protein